MIASALHKYVRLTARGSALLFAAAQAMPAFGPRAASASRPLYLGFMVAHAVHFTVVARYAKATGGRDLFPGGRSLNDVGGWPTVAGIYTFFAGLAFTGWAAGIPAATGKPRMRMGWPRGHRPHWSHVRRHVHRAAITVEVVRRASHRRRCRGSCECRGPKRRRWPYAPRSACCIGSLT